MFPKKIFIYLLLIILGIVLGFAYSIIDNIVWYVGIFMLVGGILSGFVYNYLLIMFNINKRNKIYIYFGVLILILTIFISINVFNYYQTEKVYNKEISKILRENKKILEESNNLIKEENKKKEEIENTFKKVKTTLEQVKTELQSQIKLFKEEYKDHNFNKLLFVIKNNIKNNKYEKALSNLSKLTNSIKDEKIYNNLSQEIKEFEDNIILMNELFKRYSQYDLQQKTYLEQVEQVKELIQKKEDVYKENQKLKDYSYSLKEETGFGGYIGFFILNLKKGSGLQLGGDIFTGFYLEIMLLIIDIIAFIYGVLSLLSVLKIKVCKIHNERFTKIDSYVFPTTGVKFNSTDFNDIIKLLNTKPEKSGFFSKNKTYYVGVDFYKCPKCELDSDNTFIDMVFSDYGESKIKPITGVKTYSFIINNKQFYEIIEQLKSKTL